jgi:lipopolysaccharide/colanic/teichoic acid biosynthesis glycosyltransferase
MNKPGVDMVSQTGTLQCSRSSGIRVEAMKAKESQKITTYSFWKYLMDRIFAFVLLLVLSPVLLIIAIGIVIDSPGNPLFRQERVGKDGKKFIIYKFRTMYLNNDDSKYKAFLKKYVHEKTAGFIDENGEDVYELASDPRVTKFGRLLRRTNMDELPQFINVLKGDMSVVGPRPDITYTVNMYNDHQRKRLFVKPGITGLWQTSGKRKNIAFSDMIRFDLYYVKKYSFMLDLKITVLTAGTIFRCDGS